MLLQRLVEYTERLDLPPTLYSETPIPYIIELNGNGTLLSPEPTPTADPTITRDKRGKRRLAPQIMRSVGIQPLLLADNAEYTFGLGRETSKPERVTKCHAAYLDLIDRCAAETGESAVEAVRMFLRDDPVPKIEFPADYDRGGFITFRVEGEFVTELRAVQEFWAIEHDPGASTSHAARVMQCIVCGQERPVLDRLQGKIKGIPGGQQAGTSLISANAQAFGSYGLEASLIAPTCASCGERFTKALNDLLASPRNRIILGETVFVFWTRDDVENLPPTMVNDPDPEAVELLYRAAPRGTPVHGFDDTPFYAVSLTASGGRAVVRDWMDTTLNTAWEHVRDWFEWQKIIGRDGEKGDPLSLFQLAAATVRDVRKELPKSTPRLLLSTALTGLPLPYSLLAQAVRRNQAEQRVIRPRAALIKLVLASQGAIEEGTMVQLEPDYAHPTEDQSSAAYHCGRLLAILENAQDSAIPGVKAGIVDRFYGTASSAPVAVFSRLLRGAQPHLAKLDRDKHGIYVNIQRDLSEVLSHLPVERDPRTGQLTGFPRTLTLEQQGLFSLGYYHQRAKRFTRTAGARPAADADET